MEGRSKWHKRAWALLPPQLSGFPHSKHQSRSGIRNSQHRPRKANTSQPRHQTGFPPQINSFHLLSCPNILFQVRLVLKARNFFYTVILPLYVAVLVGFSTPIIQKPLPNCLNIPEPNLFWTRGSLRRHPTQGESHDQLRIHLEPTLATQGARVWVERVR